MIFRLHKEGYSMTLWASIIVIALNLLTYFFFPSLLIVTGILSFIALIIILQFFRNPPREIRVTDNKLLYAPADGKIVAIEEATETEYFNQKKLQVSIFMSPANVHVNRNPISGTVNYFKYHPGKYLVAWHPKSSTENERTTTVISNGNEEILLRQIAGALAKRIVSYVQEGQEVVQGKDMGFIKFGSRVDLFLPLDTDIQVEIGQKVKGNITVIGKLK